MKTALLSLMASIGVIVGGCGGKHNSGGLSMKDASVENELRAVSGKRILFGHQSVGGNILEGLKEIGNANPGGGLTVIDLEESGAPAGPFLGELRIGKNGDPGSKCIAFREKARSLGTDGLDVAVMKFCYADFNRGTDAAAVLAQYAAAVDSIRAGSARLVVLHTTVPLVVRTAGWKKMIKRLLGKEESSDVANAKRSEFNELLKARYRGEPIFDLAAVESTYPDGTRQEFAADGKRAYALVADFTDDGSHLNATGRVIAARAFVHALAAITEKGGR
jgi:hypothetical protein